MKKFSFFFLPLLFSGVLVMGIFIHKTRKSLDSGIQVGAFHGKYPRSYLENKKIYSIMQIAAVRIECYCHQADHSNRVTYPQSPRFTGSNPD